MKVAIYNPYLNTLGGGERYAMGVAIAFMRQGYRVDVQWKDKDIKEKIEKRFNLNLSEVNFVKDIKKGYGYDICFWVSDGSVPLLHARGNFLHFQFPFMGVNGKTLINKMKFIRINRVICNSYFTKKVIDKEYGVDSVVIYPPVSVKQFKPRRKENIILYIGRFSQLKQAKGQDVLIKAFIKFLKKGNSEWRLILAGGSEIGAEDYIRKLRKISGGYPIQIVESPPFSQIRDLYGKAKVFWSASGFGVNEEKEPEKVEHFGITVVEAMASKCIPFVYSAGGHREIVDNGNNGYLWEKIGELVTKTDNLINDKSLQKEMAAKAHDGSLIYETDRFEQQIINLL